MSTILSTINQIQRTKLQGVAQHLFNTPFYREKLDACDITLKNLESLENWSSIPFTTKDELKTTSPLERSPFDLDACEYFFSSSGTSGQPTIYFWTQRDTEVLREGGTQAMKRVGVQSDDVALLLAPMGMPIMWYCMIQQYNAVGAGVIPLGVRPPTEMIDALFQFPASIVISLPVAGTRLFELLMSLQRTLPESSDFRQFHCGGDFLSETRRQRIERLWNIECYNFYGISEIFGPIAGECSEKDGLHFLDDYVFVEVLNPETKEPVLEGEVGVAVYTTLWEKGSPLLRYWSNDFVSLTSSPCHCGDSSSRMKFVGRPIDLATVNGRRIFASQLEERVLVFPEVGNEYEFYLYGKYGNETGELIVETIPGAQVPVAELSDSISKLFHCPVKVVVKPPAALSRNEAKPQRIIDRREH